jgi:hypothetical protein
LPARVLPDFSSFPPGNRSVATDPFTIARNTFGGDVRIMAGDMAAAVADLWKIEMDCAVRAQGVDINVHSKIGDPIRRVDTARLATNLNMCSPSYPTSFCLSLKLLNGNIFRPWSYYGRVRNVGPAVHESVGLPSCGIGRMQEPWRLLSQSHP